NTGSCALERLDKRRMIVRLNFEGASPAIADVDDAGVLPGPLHHATAVRGQALQVHARGFVGAVLAPHHAEDAQFRERRLATESLQQAVVFLGRDSVVTKHFWSDGGFFGESGGAINWVHGNQEGNAIVARAIGLGKEFSGRSCPNLVMWLGCPQLGRMFPTGNYCPRPYRFHPRAPSCRNGAAKRSGTGLRGSLQIRLRK